MTKTREPWTNEQWAALAAEDGNLDFLRFAIERGADLNKPAEHPVRNTLRKFGHWSSSDRPLDTTPLFEAVASGHLDAVEALLEAGADPHLKLEGGVTAAIAAEGAIAKALAAREADPDAAERDAFAARMNGSFPALTDRDLDVEAIEWANRVSDPFAPIFAGESLFALLSAQGGNMRFRAAVATAIGQARTPTEMLAAVEAALVNDLDDEAAALVERGALAGADKGRLDGLLKLLCRNGQRRLPKTRDLLLAAGADASPLVREAYWGNRFDEVERFAREKPETVASTVDGLGRGLAWEAMWRLAWRLNDTQDFSRLLSEAKFLLALPDARVLTGTGLGRFGPPACALLENLEDRSNIHNAKRLKRAAALAEEIRAMALAEAEGLGADGSDPNAGLPDGFNILHLAVVCDDAPISRKLVDKAAAMGADAFRRMALARAPALTLARAVELHGRSFGSEAPEAREPLRILLGQAAPSPGQVDLAVEIAGRMGVNDRMGQSGNVFADVCLWLDDKLKGDFSKPLARLFDFGADPETETEINGGRLTLLEALERLKSERARRFRGWGSDKIEENWKLVERAFLEAAGKGGGGGPARKKRDTI